MGTPLPVLDEGFMHNNLAIVIYWRKRKGIDALQNGHAALIVNSNEFTIGSNAYYVSWLSSGEGGDGIFKFRAEAGTFMYDASEWGGTPMQDPYHFPNRWVALTGLDMAQMKIAWDQMRTKNGAHWKLFDKNCATAVARILKAGGGDDFAHGHKKQMVWWPTDLLRYAKSMRGHVYRTSSGD